MQKRVLAFLMVLAMVFSLLPTSLVGAEVETATPAFALTVQKAYNQTEGSLALDLYLQGTTDAQVTGYQFTVTPAEGLSVTGAADATGNDGLAGSDTTFVYTPGATPLVVGTSRVLVATITLSGETLPAQAADAVTVADVTVTTADASYAVTDITSKTDNGAWADVTGTWQPLTKADLVDSGYKLATGNYYLVEDIADTKKITVSEANANVNLCLNGYTYTSPEADKLLEIAGKAAVVKISDCTATGEGEDLVAGKFLLKYANWGNLRVSVADAKLYASNIILEGAEDAVFSSETNSGIGNAATFYQGSAATNSLIHAEDVLIRNVNSGKTVIDTRGDGYYKNVTFVNCSGGQNSATDSLGIFATNGNPNKPGTLTIDGCKFIDCEGDVLDTNSKSGITYTLKGDTWADGDFYLTKTCKINLELGKNAKVNIRTELDKTEETLGDNVIIPEGATLTTGTVMYQNVGSFVSYKDGVFYFDSHAHDEIGFKAWNDSSSLPSEGNYYLACDVTLTAETNITYGQELNLDLNGHTITTNTQKLRAIYVDGVLNLYDCAEQYDEDGNWIGGKITGFNNITGGAIRVGRSKAGKLTDADRPTFNMYGGRLEDNGNTGSGTSGGAVYITSSRNTKDGAADERGGVFNMYGGELYANHTGTLGGAVTVWGLSATRSGDNKDGERSAIADGLGAEFNLYGGWIHGNVCTGAADYTSKNGSGGAIHVFQDAMLNIYGGQITDNTAVKGGAIHVEGTRTKLYIENGYFVNNAAKYTVATTDNSTYAHLGSGGAIYAYNTTGEQTIKNTYFHGNSAYRAGIYGYAGLGGAIYSAHNNFYIEGCEFVSNETNNHGGALVSRYDNRYMYVKDSTFTKNYAGGVGGVIYFLGAKNTVTFDGTTVTGNETKTSGAVYITSATSRLVVAGKTVIAGNTRTNGNNNQQDVFFQSQASRTNMIEVNELTDGAHINMYHYNKDCVVNKNDTADGFVRLSNDGGTQTDWDCGWITVFTGTSDNGRNVSYMDTDSDGDKEFVFGHFHTDANGNLVQFTEWTATTAPTAAGNYYLGKNITTSGTWNLKADMTICFNGKTLTYGGTNSHTILLAEGTNAYEVTFEDCTGCVSADNEYIGGGITGTKATFGSGLRLNRSGTAGGHVVNWNGGAIKNCKATATSTSSAGGAAIYMQAKNTTYPYAPTINFNGGAIYGNVTNDDNEKATAAVAGPVQLNSGCVLNINGGLFYNNACTDKGSSNNSQGGFIYNAGTVNIYDGYFYNNHAEDFGGLIHSSGTTNIYGGVFEGNYVTQGYGGVIHAGSSSSKVYVTGTADNRVLFKDNYVEQLVTTTTDAATGATTEKKTLGYAGAIEAMNGTVEVRYADFIGNKAGADGGAIRYGGGSGTTKKFLLDNCYFEGNEAARGGAIFVSSSISAFPITNCEFVNNSVTDRGGAVVFYGADSKNSSGTLLATGFTVNMSDSVFEGNYAKGYAGAVYVAQNTTMNVTGCSFIGNESKNGGVAYSSNSTLNANFTNCEFVSNVAQQGGAMFMEFYNSLSIKGCTFDGNEATGTGDFGRGGALKIHGKADKTATIGGVGDEGNVFVNNKSTVTGGAIYFGVDATSKITNSTFTGNTSGGGTIYYTGANDSTIDGCTFTENVSSGPVSAIRVEGTKKVIVKDTTITNNTSKSHGALFAATTPSTLTLQGKVVVTDNICTSRPNGKADLFFQDKPGNDAYVDASGLTEGSKIGVDTYDGRTASEPVFTTGGSAAVKDYFFVNDEDRFILHTLTVEGAEELALVKYIDENGNVYGDIQSAIQAAEAAGKTTFKMQTSTDEELTLTSIDYMDLDGHSAKKVIVPDTITLTVIDSATNDYDVDDEDGYGTITVQGSFKTKVEDTTSGSLKRYVVITHSTTDATETEPATATISAHRIYLAITAKTLRPTSNGVGFKAIFAGDQVVSENVAYGLQLTGNKDFSEVYTAKFFNLENGVGNGAPNQKSVVIYEAITADDTSRWDADLYGRPFMTVGDQTVYGAEVTVNMKAMAANALKSGDQTIIDAVNDMMTECGVSAN